MIDDVERGEVVGAVVEAEIRRLLDENGPASDPLPEQAASVTLQAPVLRGAAVVDEEFCKHLGARADAEEFGVVAELGLVVRRRGCSAGEAVGRALERLDQHVAGLAVDALKDRRLVEHDAGIVGRVDLMDAVVVDDVDRRLRPDAAGIDPEARGLGKRLFADSQRREQDHLAAGVRGDLGGPRELRQRLA